MALFCINNIKRSISIFLLFPIFGSFAQVNCESIPAGYNGICDYYYESGAIESKIEVVDGVPTRKGKTFYEDGKISSEMNMVESFSENYVAHYIVYSPEGEEQFKIQLKNGNGICQMTNENDGSVINGYYTDNKPSDVWSLLDHHGVTINSIKVDDLEPKEFSSFEELMTETASLLSQVLALASSTTVIEEAKDGQFDAYEGDEVLRKKVNDAYQAKLLNDEDHNKLGVVAEPDNEAIFPGGAKGLQSFLNNNVIYPTDAIDKDISGRVYVGFLVDVDGSVSYVRVVKKVNELLDKEALRICMLMPKWIPATKDKKNVASMCYIPIVFTLTD